MFDIYEKVGSDWVWVGQCSVKSVFKMVKGGRRAISRSTARVH